MRVIVSCESEWRSSARRDRRSAGAHRGLWPTVHGHHPQLALDLLADPGRLMAGILRAPISALQLTRAVPAQGPVGFVVLQVVVGLVQFAIGLAMFAGPRSSPGRPTREASASSPTTSPASLRNSGTPAPEPRPASPPPRTPTRRGCRTIRWPRVLALPPVDPLGRSRPGGSFRTGTTARPQSQVMTPASMSVAGSCRSGRIKRCS